MIEALKYALSDVSRFPIDRQRDAASCIIGTLSMEKLEVEWRVYTQLKSDAEPPIDFPDDYYDGLPVHMKSHSVPRNPFEPGAKLSDELADAIKSLEKAEEVWQLSVAHLLADMVEGDSWELILSPEAEAELKAAMNEDPSKSIPADEVWERLGLSKPEGPRALTGDERKVLKEGLERARRGKMGRSE